jgi:APA family basic amino acid/polyamine antiporter
MVASSTFDQLLTYIGFALGLFPMLAVAGVIVLRKRQPERFRPYRTWGYPLTPLFFLLGMAGILAVSFMGRPKESLIALATVAAGIPIYWLWTRYTAARSPAGNSGRTAQ